MGRGPALASRPYLGWAPFTSVLAFLNPEWQGCSHLLNKGLNLRVLLADGCLPNSFPNQQTAFPAVSPFEVLFSELTVSKGTFLRS